MLKKLALFAAVLVFGAAAAPASAELEISPCEIRLGAVQPGGVMKKGLISLRKEDPGYFLLEIREPAGWKRATDQRRSPVADFREEVTVTIAAVRIPSDAKKTENMEGQEKQGPEKQGQEKQGMDKQGAGEPLYGVLMTFESRQGLFEFTRVLPAGAYRETVRFRSDGDFRDAAILFSIGNGGEPVLSIEPFGIDFGTVDNDHTLSGRFRISNAGPGMLHWKIRSPGRPRDAGRFVSLQSGESRGRGEYSVPKKLLEAVILQGAWLERDGYPLSPREGGSLTFSFIGTAAVVFFGTDFNYGGLSVLLDGRPAGEADAYSPVRGRAEIRVQAGETDAQHVLQIEAKGRPVDIEGIRIMGNEYIHPPPGWVRIFPDSGTTSSETDYINIQAHTDRLGPGHYADNILIDSNGGQVLLDISVNVTRGKGSREIAVYRYERGTDQLFTWDPEREDPAKIRPYRRQGLAFRLFREDVHGTRPLYRWYNASRGDHFYSSEPGKAPPGYILEGSIGNIGSSRLPGTRELYYWRHSSKGRHYFTTESKRPDLIKRGYRYLGIVGYVK